MDTLRPLWKRKGVELLLELDTKGRANFSALLKVAGNPHTASRRLGELVDVGLATRQVEQDSRRTVTYTITPMGKRVARKVNELVELLEA